MPAPASGTVEFLEGTTLLGTGTVKNGIDTLTTSTLAVGTDPVTAAYSGDPDYNSSTSAVYGQIVTAQAAVSGLHADPDFSRAQTVTPAARLRYTVQVAPTNVTYPGTVTFSATGLPEGATISFSRQRSRLMVVSSRAVKSETSSQKRALTGGSIGSAVLALRCSHLLFASHPRNSSRYFYLLILVLGGVGATAGLTGCGYNGNGFSARLRIRITSPSRPSAEPYSISHVTLDMQ